MTNREEYAWSLRECEIKLKDNPFDYKAKFRMAMIYITEDRLHEEAIKLLKNLEATAASYNPDEVQMLLGDAYSAPKMQDFKEALFYYKKATELNVASP